MVVVVEVNARFSWLALAFALAISSLAHAAADCPGAVQAGTTQNFTIVWVDPATQVRVTGATCTFRFYNGSDVLNLTATGTAIKELSNARYTYAYAVPTTADVYALDVNCTQGSFKLNASKNFCAVAVLESSKTSNITGLNSSLLNTTHYSGILAGLSANASSVLADNAAGNNSVHAALGNGTLARAIDIMGINSSLATQANVTSVNDTVKAINASQWDHFANKTDVNVTVLLNATFNVTVNGTSGNVTVNVTEIADAVWSHVPRTLTSIDFSPVTTRIDSWMAQVMRLLRQIADRFQARVLVG